jgi:hypothetical protein
MKKIALILSLAFIACGTDDDTVTPIAKSDVAINFTQSFNVDPITVNEFSDLAYVNENGELLSVSRLRYLMTDIVLTDGDGIETVIADYNLVDVGESAGVTIESPTSFAQGDYTLSMRFGFSDADNTTAAYPDLNVVDWSVPAPLGGGYHYMQMEGMYINDADENTNYQYHAIRAAENPGDNPTLTDTSIAIDLGTVAIEGIATIIEVDMNIAEWYKNPNQWNLNELYTMLMPNYDAQIMMNQNGQNVFSLGSIIYAQE